MDMGDCRPWARTASAALMNGWINSIFIKSGSRACSTRHGPILTQTIAPLTYDATTGQSSSYLVSITAKVVLTAHDGHILYRNDAILYREQFQSTQDLSGFIQEDGYAVRRVAREFSERLRIRTPSIEQPVSTLSGVPCTVVAVLQVAIALLGTFTVSSRVPRGLGECSRAGRARIKRGVVRYAARASSAPSS